MDITTMGLFFNNSLSMKLGKEHDIYRILVYFHYEYRNWRNSKCLKRVAVGNIINCSPKPNSHFASMELTLGNVQIHAFISV